MMRLQFCDDARHAHLLLRDLAGLPPGGEVHLKSEVVQLAEAFGIETEDQTRKRLIWELVSRDDRSWAEAQQGCRDYAYITATEAERLAKELHGS